MFSLFRDNCFYPVSSGSYKLMWSTNHKQTGILLLLNPNTQRLKYVPAGIHFILG